MRRVAAHFFTIGTLVTGLMLGGCGSDDSRKGSSDSNASFEDLADVAAGDQASRPDTLADVAGKDGHDDTDGPDALADQKGDHVTGDNIPVEDAAGDGQVTDGNQGDLADALEDLTLQDHAQQDSVGDMSSDSAEVSDGVGDNAGSDAAADLSDAENPPDVPEEDTFGPSCCKSNTDCGSGFVCVGGGFASGGWCVEPPVNDECYVLADCPMGHLCTGQEICSCTAGCDLWAGTCSPMPGFCCETAADCEAGYVCAPTASNLGVCEPKPKFPGKCWFDTDCPVGEGCYGSFSCPCTASCGTPDEYGTCLPN